MTPDPFLVRGLGLDMRQVTDYSRGVHWTHELRPAASQSRNTIDIKNDMESMTANSAHLESTQ